MLMDQLVPSHPSMQHPDMSSRTCQQIPNIVTRKSQSHITWKKSHITCRKARENTPIFCQLNQLQLSHYQGDVYWMQTE